MSMQSTQKPYGQHMVRPQSQSAMQRHQSNPQYMSCQKQLRMSIIDQLSPIKDLQLNSSNRNSLYQVKGKASTNPLLISAKQNKMGESFSYNTTLNYTQESQVQAQTQAKVIDMNAQTLPKGQKMNGFEILKDQLRFTVCQLEDIKKQFDQNSQQQINQVIHVIKQSNNLAGQLVGQVLPDNNANNRNEYDKLKGIMEQMQQKITILMNDNSKITQQMNFYREDNKRLINQLADNERRGREYKENRENSNPNQPKVLYSQRELAYKLEQAEIKLLTFQISNENLKQQIQHNQLDYQGMEQLRQSVPVLEQKIQELLNQKDALIQENELMNGKITRLENQINDSKQKLENSNNYISYINQIETQCNQAKTDNQHLTQTNHSLSNTIHSLKEQVNILQQQQQDYANLKQQYQNNQSNSVIQLQAELKQATSKYQMLWQEISEMRDRFQQRTIEDESGRMLSNAEKTLFETQIANLNDKIKEQEQMLLHYENKSRSLESKLTVAARENADIKQELHQITDQKMQFQQCLELNTKLQQENDEIRWKIDNQHQLLLRKDKELRDRSDEMHHQKQLVEQAAKKNQKLEMRILYFMEQEVKCNTTHLVTK